MTNPSPGRIPIQEGNMESLTTITRSIQSYSVNGARSISYPQKRKNKNFDSHLTQYTKMNLYRPKT
jgi:hypothetical protein